MQADLLCGKVWMCFMSVENRDGEPVGMFMIYDGQDLDVDVTSTKTPRK